MGYYSEVAICMAFEDNEKRDAFYDLMSLRNDEMGYTIRQYCQKDDKYPWINYHDSSIKWYESHPTRLAFENDGGLFELVKECGGAYRILRLGEDTDDIEKDQGAADSNKVEVPWDAFYMERRIVWE